MTGAAQPARRHAEDPEGQLVAAARNHDEAAVRELVRRMNPRLFRIARGIVPSDAEAEEVVQEAYLAAFRHLGDFRGEARFATWITRITINAARMQARRSRPAEDYDTVNEERAPAAAVVAFPGSAGAEANVARNQVRVLIEEAIGGLPPDLRLPFLLHEVEGQPVAMIAADLGLNAVTVRTRLFRARLRLRRALEARLRGGFADAFPFDGARCAHMADRVLSALRGNGRGAPAGTPGH